MNKDSIFSVSRYEGIGLLTTMIFFAIIISPNALSTSDPYHLKETFQFFENFIFSDFFEKTSSKEINHDGKFLTEIITPEGKRYHVTVQLKTTPSNLPDDSTFYPKIKRPIA